MLLIRELHEELSWFKRKHWKEMSQQRTPLVYPSLNQNRSLETAEKDQRDCCFPAFLSSLPSS